MKRGDFLKSIGVGGTLVAVAPLVAFGDSKEEKNLSLEDKIDRLYPNIVEYMEEGISFGTPLGDSSLLVGTFHLLTEILDNKAEIYWGDSTNLKHKTVKTPPRSVIFRRSVRVYKHEDVEGVKERERILFYKDINEYIEKKILKDIKP